MTGSAPETAPGDSPAARARKAPRATTRASGVLAAIGHRWPTGLGIALAVATFVDGVPPSTSLAGILVAMPVCYLVFGALRGELRRPGVLALQTAGLLGFGGLALLALSVDADLCRYLLAAGWLAHAVWDFAHHRNGRVVPRAWAEGCGVVDLLGAASILLLA
ncbi:hypothetical protein [Marinactinospora rubrisoli]|uniref:Uncharacterized protein n=1 Tax=Marinactinospora rubrisoli TaxID=2715399 RepID=A0ABW2KML4_9ACTN